MARFSHEPDDKEVQKIRVAIKDDELVLNRRRVGAGIHCITLPDEYTADAIILNESLCWKGFVALNGGNGYENRRFYMYGLTPRIVLFDGSIAKAVGLKKKAKPGRPPKEPKD